MYMHGRVKKGGEDRLPRKIIFRRTGLGQHMQSVPSPTATRTSVEGNGNTLIVDTATDTPASFSKDGRKISVGDCALFKPPHDSPPFIGVICSLAFSEDKNLQLSVTWLYRLAEVKLGKGIILDAEPNELFYSFHKDEKIPAASLLHPCKVAFLPKGVELPKGISSFLCRRVYDIDNKCLWWLTDRDYIDERQDEVNKLLNRTQKEMNSIVQAGMCSPTVTSAASHLKSASDNLQHSATSALSQVKGKKRERDDQSYDPLKREHPKPDDDDSGLVRAGNLLRLETARIKEKGGLVDSESVEKLVGLIRPRMDKKLDLVACSMVAGVIAATDRFDCLSQFVQLKGLSVLDEWLQDVHKGRICDSSGSRECDKSVEELLFILLRALDKLPVNLHALQTCNIGRSVNHLRSHKNLEIQKKARSLVDTWKKRVEAEMNVLDARSGSTQAAARPSKSRLPEVNGPRTSGRSCDVVRKSSATQPAASKTPSTKVSQGDAATKSACSSPGPIKSASLTASGKEIKPRTVPNNAADVLLSFREDKNSVSVSPHVSVKDRSFSVVGTMDINKIPSGSSWHQKLNNCLKETLDPGSQKETLSSRNSSVNENANHEKFPQSTAMGEKTSAVHVAESSSHKLIIKLPNRSRCSAQCPSGGSRDPAVVSGRASPVLSYIDQDSSNCDAHQSKTASHVNVETLHGNKHKELQEGPDVGDGSSAALHDEGPSKNVDENKKSSEASRTPFSLLKKHLKVKKIRDASSTAMDALIESCYSEESASTPPGDDVGINLLASVAAREMCSSAFSPLAGSLQQNAPPEEENSIGDGSMPKPPLGDNLPLDGCQRDAGTIAENEKKVGAAAVFGSREGIDLFKEVSVEHPRDTKKPYSSLSEDMARVNADCSSVMDEKSSSALSHTSEEYARGQEVGKQSLEEIQISLTAEVCPDTEADEHGSSLAEVNLSRVISTADYSKSVERSSSSISPSDEIDCKKCIDKSLSSNFNVESKPSLIADSEISQPIVFGKDVCETQNEVDNGQLDKHCIDVKIVLKSGVPSQDAEADKNLKISKLCVSEEDKMEIYDSTAVDDTPLSAAGPLEKDSNLDFDLNEVSLGDDEKCEEPHSVGISGNIGNLLEANGLSTPMSVGFTSPPAYIMVAAAAKGHFVQVDLLRTKGELGWKRSATTSAFRPAEPRKVPQCPMNVSPPVDSASKLCRRPFDIDLNVVDETFLEDTTCQDNSRNEASESSPRGFDLDLNKVDDANYMMQYPVSGSHRLPAPPPLPFNSLFPSSLPASDVKRDFDLNNGPGFGDGVAEQSSLSQLRGGSTLSMYPLLPVSGLRPNSLEIGNLSTCFPNANPFSSVTISSVLPHRGEHPVPIVTPVAPQKMLGPSSGNPFMPDMYWDTMLSSSPTVPLPSGPSPYQMFPFGTTLPLSSGAFSLGPATYLDSASVGRLSTPTVNSQFLGSVSAVSLQYPKPFMIGLTDVSNNVGAESSSRNWSRTGFDLNAGLGALDVEGIHNFMPQRQLLISGSHTLAEEQGRLYPITGEILKRKEPEGGLDRESFRYKQPSWQ